MRINDSGTIVGEGNNDAFSWVAILKQGVISLLPGIQDSGNTNLAINSAGHVNGYSDIGENGYMWPTLWVDGIRTAVPRPPNGAVVFDYSYVSDLNDDGVIVGSSTFYRSYNGEVFTGRGASATVWSNGSLKALNTLGGSSSGAYGINNSGKVVGGASIEGDLTTHAVMWDGDVIVDLNGILVPSMAAAGWYLLYALEINDRGSIIGMASNSVTRQSSHFLLSAVPEPTSAALLLAGLAMLLGSGRLTKRRLPTAI